MPYKRFPEQLKRFYWKVFEISCKQVHNMDGNCAKINVSPDRERQWVITGLWIMLYNIWQLFELLLQYIYIPNKIKILFYYGNQNLFLVKCLNANFFFESISVKNRSVKKCFQKQEFYAYLVIFFASSWATTTIWLILSLWKSENKFESKQISKTLGLHRIDLL